MKLCQYINTEGERCEAYTMNERVEFCASHAAALRKADRDSLKEKAKRKALPKFSEKKAAKILPYAVVRRITLKERPVCEININGICDGLSQELHHCSTAEADYLDMNTVKTTCRACHSHVETKMSAEERRRFGLLIDPVNKKFEEPHKI